jgi:hypothetical protein
MLPSKELCFLPHPVPRGNGFLSKQNAADTELSCRRLRFLWHDYLDVKTEMHDISIFNNIFLAFKAHQTLFLGSGFTF